MLHHRGWKSGSRMKKMPIFNKGRNWGVMWFLAGLIAGFVLGFFTAGLCNIAAKTEETCIERRSDVEKKIEKVA